MKIADYKLFTPLTIGKDLVLKNRVVMSPLTRGRAEIDTHNATAHMVEYYGMRAGSGLIIAEASAISPQGFGWYGAPAIYTEEHAEAWKQVTEAVHANGGKIFLQLWHMGRQAHSSFNGDKQIVSASALHLQESHLKNAKGEYVNYEVPRALDTDEIPGIVEDYRRAGELAKKAGFDGVEIHSANGYLIDQFLQSVTNHRTDKYGGSIENRARLILEVVEALKTVWPSDRIAARLSPNRSFGGMGSEDNYEQFMYTIEELGKHNLAYLALLDGGSNFGAQNKSKHVSLYDAKVAFDGPVIANVEYTRDLGEGALRSGAADAVSYGRDFIANPDLTERFLNDWPLNPEAPHEVWWNPDKGTEGYTTYQPYQAN